MDDTQNAPESFIIVTEMYDNGIPRTTIIVDPSRNSVQQGNIFPVRSTGPDGPGEFPYAILNGMN